MQTFTCRSQCGQDGWVAWCLEGKRDGRFLDVGAGDPEIISNTVQLERELGWRGVLIDVETAPRLVKERAPDNYVLSDALEVDWREIARFGRFDYLSLDLEPAEVTLRALVRLLAADVQFTCATIEHDSYRFGEDIANAMRAMLEARGYVCVMRDVLADANDGSRVPLEDWWVDPIVVSEHHARTCAAMMRSALVTRTK